MTLQVAILILSWRWLSNWMRLNTNYSDYCGSYNKLNKLLLDQPWTNARIRLNRLSTWWSGWKQVFLRSIVIVTLSLMESMWSSSFFCISPSPQVVVTRSRSLITRWSVVKGGGLLHSTIVKFNYPPLHRVAINTEWRCANAQEIHFSIPFMASQHESNKSLGQLPCASQCSRWSCIAWQLSVTLISIPPTPKRKSPLASWSATVDYHLLETFHAKSDRSLPHPPLMDVFMVIHSVVKITAIIWTEDQKIELPISFSLANYHSRGMSMDTPI